MIEAKGKNIIHLVKIWVFRLFIVWLFSFIGMFSVIMAYSIPDKSEKTDCLIILGAGLRGESPSLVLKERLDTAVKYIKLNPHIEVIVSGGRGIGEISAEAEVMGKYLIDHGIQGSKVLKEEKSTNTIENLKFSKAVYERNSGLKLEKVMIITSDFHMFRSKFLAERIGVKPYGISSRTPLYLYPKFIVREYFAVIKSFIFDKA